MLNQTPEENQFLLLLNGFLTENNAKFTPKQSQELMALLKFSTLINTSVKGEYSSREEANAITAFCFRNTVLESYHANSVPINDARMKTLMVEASSKLDIWLLLKKHMDNEKYHDLYSFVVRGYGKAYARDWVRK